MRKNTSDPLRGQAQTLVAAADAAAGWFRAQTPSALSAARTARLRCRGWRQEAVAAARTRRGPVKADISDLSFSLREAVEHAVAAVCEAARLETPPDADLADAAGDLGLSARALARAASVKGEPRAEALVESKRHASEAGRRCRAVRAEANGSHLIIESIKRSEIAGLLSSAAEAVQQACDALAGSLSE
ncbi:MAG: hypothetical protein A2506_03070 [Elusimicrobia bacterium RIFOXYD12_FULL_66_9]|nr:MAG: hypothetical protein A2506_03070 [Elusimicrobia bacterium RIFOXYD12_FULL_66_9]